MPVLPPKTKNFPEPDYEIIEFSGQQYSNEVLKAGTRSKTPSTPGNHSNHTIFRLIDLLIFLDSLQMLSSNAPYAVPTIPGSHVRSAHSRSFAPHVMICFTSIPKGVRTCERSVYLRNIARNSNLFEFTVKFVSLACTLLYFSSICTHFYSTNRSAEKCLVSVAWLIAFRRNVRREALISIIRKQIFLIPDAPIPYLDEYRWT